MKILNGQRGYIILSARFFGFLRVVIDMTVNNFEIWWICLCVGLVWVEMCAYAEFEFGK